MRVDKFGQPIYQPNEVFESVMCSTHLSPGPFLIENYSGDVSSINTLLNYNALIAYIDTDQSITEFDSFQQTNWFMPDNYKEMDIAKYVLDLCECDDELQRCGEELLLFQEKGLFNLLCYLVYLIDVMELNNLIWGVGRGSSVASFVLYKLKVHKVNSLYYNLAIDEFLR